MKFIYENKEYKVDLYKYSSNKKTNPSKPHTELKIALQKKYPLDIIIEEFPLPGLKPKLYADFFLPGRKEIYEIDGIQHDKFIRHFHKNKSNFFKSIARDKKKENWCHENEIILIRIKYGEWDGLV